MKKRKRGRVERGKSDAKRLAPDDFQLPPTGVGFAHRGFPFLARPTSEAGPHRGNTSHHPGIGFGLAAVLQVL